MAGDRADGVAGRDTGADGGLAAADGGPRAGADGGVETAGRSGIEPDGMAGMDGEPGSEPAGRPGTRPDARPADPRWRFGVLVRAGLPLLFALTLVEIGSGLVLDAFEADLLRYPSLLVLVPVTIGTAGNLGSVLAARLSTAFHLGTLSFSPGDERLAGNALATVALAVTLFPPVGAGAWALAAATVGAVLSPGTVVAVALASGSALSVLAVGVTLVATYAAYRLEMDPDDVVVPVVTNVCDVLGVVVLFVVVGVAV